MNSINFKNELLRVLQTALPDISIVSDNVDDAPSIPYAYVTVTSEDVDNVLHLQSEIDADVVIINSSYDADKIDHNTIKQVLYSGLEADITSGGLTKCYKIVPSGVELTRGDKTSETTLSIKSWVYDLTHS